MKKIFVLLFFVSVISFSCSQLGLEPEEYNTKRQGIYSINSIDGRGNYYVQYADLDSLDNFKDIGFSFYSGFWLAGPDHYSNPLFNLYIIATLNKIYFFDTRTNKLIKQIDIPYLSHGFEDNFGVGSIKFLPYNNQSCLLVRCYGVYLIDLIHQDVLEVIFEGRSGQDNLLVKSASLTLDMNSLYLLTVTPTIFGDPQKLYKVDLVKKTTRLIYQLSPNNLREDTTQAFSLGVSKDYVICTDNENFFKFSTKFNTLLDRRKLSTKLFKFYQHGEPNSLICFSDSSEFYLFNTETLSVTKHYEINTSKLRGNYYEFNDGLYFLVPSNPEGKNFIVNLSTKEIKYSFTRPKIFSFIIREILDQTSN